MSKRISTVVAVIALCALGFIGLHATVSTPFSYTKASFVNQTATITSVTLVATATKADYTVFLYSEILGTSPCTSAISPFINWTDDNGPNSVSLGAASCGSGLGAVPTTIHAAPGTSVTLTVTYFPATTNNPYSVFATVLGQ